MNKAEFLAALQAELSGLPVEDVQPTVDFYGEMIDDYMEEGMSEEEAVASVGPVRDIVAQILAETPLPKLVRAKVQPKHPLKGWEVMLLVLGSPVWIPLLFAGILVLLSCYAALWSVIVSLYAVDLSLALCAVASIIGSIFYLPSGSVLPCIFLLGTGLMSAGLSVLLFFAFGKVTAWILRLSKQALLALKFRFLRKEDTV